MKKFVTNLKDSALELRRLRVLTTCAMLGGLAIVLGLVATIDYGEYIRIGFSSIPNQLVDWLFGPVTGAIFGGAMDIVKFMVKPTGAFFIGYTFNAALAGFIYGVSYYKRPISAERILVTKLIVTVVVNMFLNTLWISLTLGKAFFVIFPARALKDILMWPIDSVIFLIIAKGLEATGVLKLFRKDK